jgi:catechol 2,3-dioxygenase-like lactoylglutathione lyase family enzyme
MMGDMTETQQQSPIAEQDYRLELVILPVTDVDRAKAFYVDRAGFTLDYDYAVSDEVRFVQLTPRGSACSIAIGKGLTEATPGTVQGLQMVVGDAQAAHDELAGRGVVVTDVDDQPWGRFVTFADPDGNRWVLQQLPPRD